MKYKTKNDFIINQKNEEKQWKKDEETETGYRWIVDIETTKDGIHWSTHPFGMLYDKRKKQKPFMNLYKEITKLNKWCKTEVS